MMKHQIKLIALIALMSVSYVYGQSTKINNVLFRELGLKWTEYERDVINNVISKSTRYYNETVSIQEMKDAFYKNKNIDKQSRKANYQDFDIVKPSLHPEDKYLMVLSPLSRHSNKDIRECHGIWDKFGNVILKDVVNKKGESETLLFEELINEKSGKWLDGEIIMLSNPCWYMGFVVSPRAYWQIYSNGERIEEYPHATYTDFFAYAAYSSDLLIDGGYEWTKKTCCGARLMGTVHTMKTDKHYGVKEKQFSVLLYTKAASNNENVCYSLELLEPANPDSSTKELFKNLKKYVERIPSGTFAPYYTTDLRLMTGRYYKVTVNKCGWLIQDYLDL